VPLRIVSVPASEISASDFACGPRRRDLDQIRLARVERDINRIKLNQRVERSGRRPDQRTFRRLVAPQSAREWGGDLGVAEVELAVSNRGPVRHQRASA